MTTANQVIFATLRKLRVVDAQGTVEPSQFVTACELLNDMMTRWEADGTSMGWTNVSAPDDVCHFPDENKLAVVYNLAMFLAPEYGKQIDPIVASAAVAMKSALNRDVFVANPLNPRTALPGTWFRYNVYSDSYN